MTTDQNHPRNPKCPGDGNVKCGHRRIVHSRNGCGSCPCTVTYMQL